MGREDFNYPKLETNTNGKRFLWKVSFFLFGASHLEVRTTASLPLRYERACLWKVSYSFID